GLCTFKPDPSRSQNAPDRQCHNLRKPGEHLCHIAVAQMRRWRPRAGDCRAAIIDLWSPERRYQRRRDMSGNSTNGQSKRIVPTKFAHAVLRTNKFRQMVDWYQTVLQANVVFENEMLAFMTYDDEHHRLAIAAFPGIV